MDRRGQAAGKAKPELLCALHIKIADLLGLAVYIPVQRAAAGQVHRAEDKSLVHRQIKAAVPLDAAHIAQRAAERLPQRNANVLGGVVIVHLHIPVAGKHQIKPAVPRKQLKHVVQKAAAGVHLVHSHAVQVQRQVDLSFSRVSFDPYLPHGSVLLQYFIQRRGQCRHLFRRADRYAQIVGNAWAVKVPHKYTLCFQRPVERAALHPVRAGKEEV